MRLTFVLLLLGGLHLPAHAHATPPHATTAGQTASALSGLQAGRTTMQQAEQRWRASQASVTGQFYGNALDSFYNGQAAEVSNLRVIVSEVEGLPRLGTARFSFFDGVLFRIHCSFAAGSRYDDTVQYLSSLYGAPMSSNGQQTYWQNGEVWVSLLADSHGQPVMQQEHRKLARLVRTSNVEVYAAYVVAKPGSRSIQKP